MFAPQNVSPGRTRRSSTRCPPTRARHADDRRQRRGSPTSPGLRRGVAVRLPVPRPVHATAAIRSAPGSPTPRRRSTRCSTSDPRPVTARARPRRQLLGDRPAQRQRLLAADAGHAARRRLAAGQARGAQRHVGAAGGGERRRARGRLRGQRGLRRARVRARAGSSPTSPATRRPRCTPTCAGCRRWPPWSSLGPGDPDVVDPGLDEAGGRRVGGLHHDLDGLTRPGVERLTAVPQAPLRFVAAPLRV